MRSSVLRKEMVHVQKRSPRQDLAVLPLALGTILAFGVVPDAPGEAMVPGVAAGRLSPALKGRVLIEELNCTGCHATDPSLAAGSKKAPRLSDIGSRVKPYYLEAFIRDPHGTKPGTTMPDLLSHLGEEQKKQTAESLTHFLLSLKKNNFAPRAPDAVAAEQGQRLFHSRGCAACHSPRDAAGKELLPGNSVPLGDVSKKYSFRSLVDFLRNPLATRPSGRMPDMRLQGNDLERIAHFLLQNTRVPGRLSYTFYRGRVWEGLDSEEVNAVRAGLADDFSLDSLGRVEHHSAVKYEGWINLSSKGRYTFYLKMNGGSLLVDGKEIVRLEPSDRRGVKSASGSAELDAGWRRIQLTYFHTGRDPVLSFEMEGPQFARKTIPSSMLSISDRPVPAFEPRKVDPGLAARGREAFGKLGCANCHDDLKVEPLSATAFSKLDARRGCLGGEAGPWPRFDLSTDQRDWITSALPRAALQQISDKERIDKTLVTFNCIACHERAGLGGVADERNALFTGTQPALGNQGRLPPPLTDVGAKLKPEWIADVLLRGKRQRDYLDASMPQFGEANIGHLVELFDKVDKLETAALPKVGNIQESKDAGYQLAGTDGFSCIACHEFNGQKPGEICALDIALLPDRLKKNWFSLYMRQPSRFHPAVIMPSFWPDGKSIRPNVLGGDTGQQIEALWNYLADGSHARKPVGLSRQSNELRVSDVTEVCRGQSPIGYRGIAVGYPERINLSFDAGEMALRQLWKGDFVNVDFGRFRPRGTDLVNFPPGIPFHRLKSMEENWPYKGKTNQAFPQDHGYQFRGYHLDAKRRPTLLYHYGDVGVEDFFEDVRGKDGSVFFRRTITFQAPAVQAPFYFRAAVGNHITRQSDRSFGVDQLQLRITSQHTCTVRDGSPGDVLIPLNLPAGRSTLTLEYQW